MIALAFIAIILVIAFGMFYILKIQTIANYKKYPSSTDCSSIQAMYNNDYRDSVFMYYANLDKNETMKGEGTGMFQCYCKGFFDSHPDEEL